MNRRTTIQSTLVLDAIVAGAAYGFDIMETTGLPSGTVYPILRRLEAGGLVRSQWESERAAHREGRPPRRNYQMTAAGRKALAESRERVEAQLRALGAGLLRGRP